MILVRENMFTYGNFTYGYFPYVYIWKICKYVKW